MARMLRMPVGHADDETSTRTAKKLPPLPRPTPLSIGLTPAEERRLVAKLRRLAREHGRSLVWKFEFWFDHYLGDRSGIRLEDYLAHRERDRDDQV